MADDDTASAWARTIYTSDWTAVFHRLAREKYARLVDHRELAEDARQRLAMRLAALGERDASPRLRGGYIFVAFKRALVDAFRDIMGRQEPRQWLKDQGPLGERLFDLYCLMHLSPAEVLTALHEDSELQAAGLPAPELIRGLLAEMDRRQECAGRPRDTVSLHADANAEQRPPDLPAVGADPAELLEQEQVDALRGLLFGDPLTALPEPLSLRIRNAFDAGDGALLDDEQLLILRCQREGIPERRIGELLGGLSVRQVRYRRQQALERLRAVLARAGMRAEDFA